MTWLGIVYNGVYICMAMEQNDFEAVRLDFHFRRCKELWIAERRTTCTFRWKRTKKTRTNVSAKSPVGSNTCLFCDLLGILSEEDPPCRSNKLTKEMKSKQLYRVTSFNRDNNIRESATAVGNTKLLAKLAEGDLIVREACYHKNCMILITREAWLHKQI